MNYSVKRYQPTFISLLNFEDTTLDFLSLFFKVQRRLWIGRRWPAGGRRRRVGGLGGPGQRVPGRRGRVRRGH